MSRHISIFFDQVKWDGFEFVFAAKFKEKFAKFLVQPDLDGVRAPGAAPVGVMAADVVSHLFAIVLRGLPVHALLCGVEDPIPKGLGGGGLEAYEVVLDGDIV